MDKPIETILLISPYWKEQHRWMVSSLKLAELWQQLGYRVIVLCMGTTKGAKHEVDVVSPTLTIHRVQDIFLKDPWNYGTAFGFGRIARCIARDIRPDRIVINKILFWSSFSMIPLRLAGYHVILLTDALVGITWWPRSRLAQVCAAIYAWTGGQLIMRMATRIVLFHPQPEKVLRRLGVAGKTQVIPTGIDGARYAKSDHSGKTIDQSVTVTYVGRLESVKGVDDFIAAALKVKADHPQINIQVVGWYNYSNNLVRSHERDIAFLGLRDDVQTILQSTDIFVLPSYSEGLSNALMEAMASSCACIASDIGGNAFLIRNGVSGFLFPVGDREALSAHIRRLVEDPAKRRALGQAARERIEKEFDWKIVGEKYRKLFEH